MSGLLASVVAALPVVALKIASKLFTDAFMQSVAEKVLVAGLRKAASLSTNTLDDELVAEVEQRLRG